VKVVNVSASRGIERWGVVVAGIVGGAALVGVLAHTDGEPSDKRGSCPGTLEDIYGDSGPRFQGSVGFVNFEADSNPEATTGFGIAVDDMKFEWREFTLEQDTTNCAISGTCATLDIQTSNFFEGVARLDITLADTSPHSPTDPVNDCNLDGDFTDDGICSGDNSVICSITTADCSGIGVCVANSDFADDTDCDNNGTSDVVVEATNEAEVTGEIVVLNGPGPLYDGSIPISSNYDVPGTLFVATQGIDNPTITVFYTDRNDGLGNVCDNTIDPNPAAAGRIDALSTVFLTSADVTINRAEFIDNGDQDFWMDDFETITMQVEISNKTTLDLTGLTIGLSTNDIDVSCITNGIVQHGDLDALETAVTDGTPFEFIIGDIGRTDPLADLSIDLTFNIAANEFDSALVAQTLSFAPDLNVTGGAGPTTYFEGFEGGFGSFTTMHIDEDMNPPDGDLGNHAAGLINGDGSRCQYSDPDWEFSNSFGSGVNSDCYPGVTNLADAYYFHATTDRAFSGTTSMHYGVFLDAVLGFTTPLSQLEALRTIDPIDLGWDKVCSVTPQNCVGEGQGNCPAGQLCLDASPKFSFKHQISLADDKVVIPGPGAADRGVVHIQLANNAGDPVGDWVKIEPFLNSYDYQNNDGFFGCMFDPPDDGNNEDMFFDPEDPRRRLGPSSTCVPEFTFVEHCDTDGPFDAGSIGRASDGPGLQGSSGVGTWVQPEFDLRNLRGRRVRMRFTTTSIKAGGAETWEALFAPLNPDPREDGWFIDDVTMTDVLLTPAIFSADLVDNSALDGCGEICPTDPVAVLVADPTSLPAPGQVVTLGASASTVASCLNGVLQYQFKRDGSVVQDWTDNPEFVDAPTVGATYEVNVRCATDTTCVGNSTLPFTVGCPGSTTPVFFDPEFCEYDGAAEVASCTSEALVWNGPEHGICITGDLATLRTGDYSNEIIAAGADEVSCPIEDVLVDPGDGAWFLVNFGNTDGTAKACNATWRTPYCLGEVQGGAAIVCSNDTPCDGTCGEPQRDPNLP